MPASYIVQLSTDSPDPATGNRPSYEVSQAEFERLVSLGIVLSMQADPTGISLFDQEVAELVADVGSGTRAEVAGVVGVTDPKTHTHTASQVSDSTAIGRSVLTAADAAAGRTAIGAAPTTHTHTASQVSDSTAIGRSVLTAADAAAGRTALGAAPTTHTHTASQVSDSTAIGRSVLTAVDAAAGRTALGAAPADVATAITAAPARLGQVAVVAGVAYISTGTTAAADWKAATA